MRKREVASREEARPPKPPFRLARQLKPLRSETSARNVRRMNDLRLRPDKIVQAVIGMSGRSAVDQSEGMSRRSVVLVTGMSGTGKSAALTELKRRGHRVIDTDDPGWIVETHTASRPEGSGTSSRSRRSSMATARAGSSSAAASSIRARSMTALTLSCC